MKGRPRPRAEELSPDVLALAKLFEAIARKSIVPTVSAPIGRSEPDEKLLLRIEEAAERLSIGRSKTDELISRGALPVVRLGRTVRVPTDALRDWIRQRIE